MISRNSAINRGDAAVIRVFSAVVLYNWLSCVALAD